MIPGTLVSELIEAMKRLSANGFLSLRIWDDALHQDRDYHGEQEDEKFFYGPDGFFIRQTLTSDSYLEQIEPFAKPKSRGRF
jgi:hypothetical protein